MPSPTKPAPDFPAPPPPRRGGWWSIALAAMLALVVSVVLTFLTLGYFAFFALVAGSIFLIIGLQYLLWGWLFERIYRTGPAADDGPSPEKFGRS